MALCILLLVGLTTPPHLPHVSQAHTWDGTVSDDELDDDELDELNDLSSADESAAEASAEASGSAVMSMT